MAEVRLRSSNLTGQSFRLLSNQVFWLILVVMTTCSLLWNGWPRFNKTALRCSRYHNRLWNWDQDKTNSQCVRWDALVINTTTRCHKVDVLQMTEKPSNNVIAKQISLNLRKSHENIKLISLNMLKDSLLIEIFPYNSLESPMSSLTFFSDTNMCSTELVIDTA